MVIILIQERTDLMILHMYEYNIQIQTDDNRGNTPTMVLKTD